MVGIIKEFEELFSMLEDKQRQKIGKKNGDLR